VVVEQLTVNTENFLDGLSTKSSTQSPTRSYGLQRFPLRTKETLRAWDAADEYLLKHLNENALLTENSSILIINDDFGGLSIPLSQYKPVVMTDSYLSVLAIAENENHNNIESQTITIIDSLHLPDNELENKPNVVLIKIPKNLSLLEDQLHRLRPLLVSDTKIIAASMSKNIHKSTLALFEKIIGPTKTSLAKKKARLIFSEYDKDLNVGDNPYPYKYPLDYKLDDVNIEVSNHASVFSTSKLDIGTRFFLENLPAGEQYKTIVDLGCGNGVLGIFSAIKNPQAKIIFTDESYMAVDSAITNFLDIFSEEREVEFLQTDCLQGIEENSVSLVLCNPPFHQNNAINDYVAWQMFVEAKAVLEVKGELWVIGNRHLAYHAKLKKLFGHCETVASNNKFTLLKVIKE